jgi:hypothetical protein
MARRACGVKGRLGFAETRGVRFGRSRARLVLRGKRDSSDRKNAQYRRQKNQGFR